MSHQISSVRRDRRRRRGKPGVAPGTLTFDPEAQHSAIRVMAYGPEGVEEREIQDSGELQALLAKWPVTWVNVEGLGDGKTIQRIGEIFKLHALALEDVVNTHQRPKVDQYGDQYFIVTRMLSGDGPLESEQLSLFFGERFVLTFQERTGGDCLDPVRERIRLGRGRIRTAGPGYLTYAIVDAVVDHYFPVLERYGERLQELEEQVLADPSKESVLEIQAVRRDLLAIRRAVWPLREAINTLVRDASPLITDETRLFLRDAYDHSIQLIDLLENHRELAAGLMEFYLSSLAQRTNDVMRVLTIIATIFIPLTFIAGVYGMNFDPTVSPWSMPELRWYLGYPFSLVLMLAVAVGLLFFFRRKGWLGSQGAALTARRLRRGRSRKRREEHAGAGGAVP